MCGKHYSSAICLSLSYQTCSADIKDRIKRCEVEILTVWLHFPPCILSIEYNSVSSVWRGLSLSEGSYNISATYRCQLITERQRPPLTQLHPEVAIIRIMRLPPPHC